jgi:phage baseplate assembly protein W
MVSNTSTVLVKDKSATLSNLKLLLASDKRSLFGDPYFGTNLKKLTFEQNNQILRDLVIDDIYTAIIDFMPQIWVRRSDITIRSERAKIYVEIRATNLLDYQTNLYTIDLTEMEEV